uniref:Exosome complex component CSL4 n=1 Tax=Plectus sambesii TaxID=2011161 RepID=A0A914WTQ2_9BILA
MTATTSEKKICVPGERLFADGEEHRSGKGTHSTHGFIYAAVAGFLHVVPSPIGEEKASTVEVRRFEDDDHAVPFLGAIVTAKVLNIGSRFANCGEKIFKRSCSIVCVGNSILSHPFNAQLRREDIQATERDKVEVQKCVRPADVILARVIGLGDNQTSFYLSTAEEELGVVFGTSDAGFKLIPISWIHMQCSLTSDKEQRKVAKVPNLNLKTTSS